LVVNAAPTPSDTTKPVLNLPNNITAEATGSDGATVPYSADATDNVDGTIAANCLPVSGNTFPLGTTTVNCSATDAAGNTANGSFTVTVQDTTAPSLTVPNSPVVVEATGANGATANFASQVSATDAVDPSPSITCTPASGTVFELGTTQVSCKAKDAAGNESAAKTFDVTVQDTTAPSLTVPNSPVVVEATGANGATVNFANDVSASDSVDPSPSVNCTPASGTVFELGTTQVSCKAKDASGNESAAKTFDVKVQDTTAPALTVPSNTVVVEATSAAGATANFASQVSATDAVDANPQVTCTPASGTNFSLGTTQVSCKAKDAAGNESAAKTFDVKVQDTTAPTLGSPTDVSEIATSSSGAVVNYTKPSATDAVDPNPTVTCLPAPGTTFPVGSTTVSCTAKDAAGNISAAKTFKVSVSYGWSGFLQPINTPTNMPTAYKQSLFKIGSTVPVKFQLTGASAGITDGNFYLKYIRTGNGDGIGESEVVATATGNTGTQFRYSEGQYIYNWSTKGITLGGNYEVRVYTDAAMTNLLGSQSVELKK
jgi:hypothetical protein